VFVLHAAAPFHYTGQRHPLPDPIAVAAVLPSLRVAAAAAAAAAASLLQCLLKRLWSATAEMIGLSVLLPSVYKQQQRHAKHQQAWNHGQEQCTA
jgi:hypothetical protein